MCTSTAIDDAFCTMSLRLCSRDPVLCLKCLIRLAPLTSRADSSTGVGAVLRRLRCRGRALPVKDDAICVFAEAAIEWNYGRRGAPSLMEFACVAGGESMARRTNADTVCHQILRSFRSGLILTGMAAPRSPMRSN